MARDKLSSKSKVIYTGKEKDEKLSENDRTFTNEDPDFGKDINNYKNIIPERKFTVKDWRPRWNEGAKVRVKPIANLIGKTKLNKGDYFYKIHRDELEMPIYIILRMIELGDYFPKVMRKSKLTFLDSGRAIFSLDPLTKIVEAVLSSEFNDCLRKHYAEHGDPMQMAYEPSRGTTSCNAITFTLCDIALFATGKPVAQTFADLVKAFNMANRTVMLEQVHLIAGAGNICRSRFDDRVYLYDGIERGIKFNRGVDPGAPISVLLFKMFMNTDVALTALNPSLLWPAPYSDDRAPLFEADEYVNGNAQLAWNSSNKWATESGVEYHTQHDDKKRHTYLEYSKVEMKKVKEFGELVLGDIPFELTDHIRELGLNICTNKSVKDSKKLVDKWGYYFRPENNRLKSIAYRMQAVRDDYPPTFMRSMVMCYFCGVVRFSSCLYWVRSVPAEINNMRFYYVMAVSAILKMNAQEIVGGAACKQMLIGKDNSGYLKLLGLTGLPTIEEMAMVDAVATTKQVASIKPEFFSDLGTVRITISPKNLRSKFFITQQGRDRRSSRRSQRPCRYGEECSSKAICDRSKEVQKAGLPLALSEVVSSSDAIIGDIWRLACAWVKLPKREKELSIWKYEDFYGIAKRFCTNPNGKIEYLKAHEHYKTLCLAEFKLIEPQARRLAFGTPTKKLEPNKTCRTAPPEWDYKGRKKLKTNFFNCNLSAPVVEQMDISENCETAPICVVCGYIIEPLIENGVRKWEMTKCRQCKRTAHTKCLDTLSIKPSTFRCSRVKRHLGKDSSEMFRISGHGPVPLRPIPPRRHEMCLICGSSIDSEAPDNFRCIEECKFFAHKVCIEVHAEVIGIPIIRRSEFTCSNVYYQFKPSEIESGKDSDESAIVVLYNTAKLRGRVNTSKYMNRQKRWLNGDMKCALCGRWYGVNEDNHISGYCAGAGGSPITERNTSYPFAHMKRFKSLTFLEP